MSLYLLETFDRLKNSDFVLREIIWWHVSWCYERKIQTYFWKVFQKCKLFDRNPELDIPILNEPGGVSMISTSRSRQQTSVKNCLIMALFFGPRQTTASESLLSRNPMDITLKPRPFGFFLAFRRTVVFTKVISFLC